MIVLSSPTLGFAGGIERHVFDLAAGLRARGHQVSLIYGATGGAESERYASVFTAIAPIGQPEALLRQASAVYLHKLVGTLLEHCPSHVTRVVAIHDHDSTCVRRHRYLPLSLEPCVRSAGLTCVAHGCAVVRPVQGLVPLGLKSPWRLITQTRQLARDAALVTCSHFLKRTLVDVGVPAQRIRVIHPVPPDSALRPPEPAPARPSLLFAGQAIRGKGLDVLLNALARLPDVTLRVVGGGNALARERARARQLGLASRVEFVGAVPPEALEAEYDRARLVVVPSRWPEPFGMVGIEAMRRGRLVVGAGHGGIPEWLEDGVTGWTFPANDVPALARTIERGLRHPRFDAMSEIAQRRAEERFSHQAMLLAVEQMLSAAPASHAAAADGSLAG